MLLGVSAALVLAGLWRVDGAMAALGSAGLVLAGIGALAARANLRGLALDLSGPHVAAVGQPARLQVSLGNPRHGLDAFGIQTTVKVPGSPESGSHAAWVAGRSAADVELRCVPGQRGDHDQIHVELSSEFPCGFFRARRVLACPHRLLVFPRPLVPVELLSSGAWVDDTPRSAVAAGEAQGEPRGLRPYRAGDPVRAIAWPATLRSHARGGGPVVRELDPPGFHPREAIVLFHSCGTERALIRPDRFEKALSLAWGALRHFQRQGIPVRLVADFDGWKQRKAGNRRQLGACGELLAKAWRAAGTEAHEVQAVLAGLDAATGVLIVSDMPRASWGSSLRPTGPCVAVDIVHYEPKARPARAGTKLHFGNA
ncbi:DUF58 domain-containing protein [Luteolibacter marinus]|uniref:DUF58 domain-containing protein n=1 Tax=Luteolibacter marinus TaxID=2776705 RepID=UPI001866DF73|nr:DUF58 domain-containing protein [Luteolibacter marinus]